jgi:uncharacterized protein
MSCILMDTGPLVAYLDADDAMHDWAVEKFAELEPRFYTCEPVITETCFLMAHLPAAQNSVGELMIRGIIEVRFDLQNEHARVFDLMRKYRDLPMALADACLVCMAEDFSGSRVFTVDSDFGVYRLRGRRAVPLIAPF